MDRPARFFVPLSSAPLTEPAIGHPSQQSLSQRSPALNATPSEPPPHGACGTVVTLSERDTHHARDVLRLSVDQLVHIVTLPDQRAYSGIIVSLHPSVQVRLSSPLAADAADGRGDTLLLPMLKGDRSEWAIEKAVELGVSAIVIYEANRSVSRLKERSLTSKLARWERIAEAAAKQSSRRSIPSIVIHDHFLAAISNQPRGIYGSLAPASRPIRELTPIPSACVAVGPEGGFSEEELSALEAAQFTPVSLGPLVLRAETAAITLLASLNALWGVPKS